MKLDATRRYGVWAGNPNGVKEDETKCVKGVWTYHIERQCSKKRGYGKDGLYCKQHAKQDGPA